MRTVTLPGGVTIPALGQGTWNMGDDTHTHDAELAALRAGIAAGMTVLDTAEMYGNGRSEQLVGEAIQHMDRSSLFIISKVLPSHATLSGVQRACAQTLARLQTDYIDLYLLHWRGHVPLADTVAGFRALVRQGKIRHWGVSNFDTEDMKELWNVEGGRECAVNQVLYHLGSRGIEHDLLPWLTSQQPAVVAMAYCPLGQSARVHRELYESAAVQQVAARHGVSVAAVLLAFVMRSGQVVAIPKSGQVAHTRENAKAGALRLSEEDVRVLSEAFPAPMHKVPLDIV